MGLTCYLIIQTLGPIYIQTRTHKNKEYYFLEFLDYVLNYLGDRSTRRGGPSCLPGCPAAPAWAAWSPWCPPGCPACTPRVRPPRRCHHPVWTPRSPARQAHMSTAPLLSRLEVASATTMSPSPSPPHLSQNMQQWLHDVTCKAAVRITRYGWVLGKLQYI